MYDGYADGDYSTEGYTDWANVGRDYYDDDYIYASRRLGIDCLLLFYLYVLLNYFILCIGVCSP